MGGAVFPPCFLTWGQTMVEVIKIIATFFKRSHAHTATLSAPNPAAGHPWPFPVPETPGHVQASVGQSLVGSLLLSPGTWWTQGSVCALQESVFQSCVSSGSSMEGLMVTSSKRAYAVLRSAAPRASVSAAVNFWHIPLQETLSLLSQSLWGLWVLVCTRFVWVSLAGMGFDSKCDFAPPTILLGLLLCPLTSGISSKSHEILGWMKYTLESRFLWEISITSDMQIAPPSLQKVNRS